MEKATRNGYDLYSAKLVQIFKRKEFARWQAAEELPDSALCEAVQEMENGLAGASLGGLLYKKRIARAGSGKSGGYRVVLAARNGSRYVFLHGFPKSSRANISEKERKALQFAGRVFLDLSDMGLAGAIEIGVLLEVHCGEQDH